LKNTNKIEAERIDTNGTKTVMQGLFFGRFIISITLFYFAWQGGGNGKKNLL
jgi:hypothetical protein